MLFTSILLQITTGAPAVTDTAAVAQQQKMEEGMSVFKLLLSGGVVMIPILILSLLALYLFIERFMYINRASKVNPSFLMHIKDKLTQGDIKGAISFASTHDYPVAKMLEKGLIRLGSPMRDIESAIEHTATVEINKMEKNLSYLAAIAAIAPMMGFLGTVVGMIKAFYHMSIANNISIGIIAEGIYTKMVTSASGLIVGIIAYTFYTILSNKIDTAISTMENTTTDFLDMLYKPSL